MTNNNYLIKIIQKRKETDERETEGGGDNSKLPDWVMEGPVLEKHSRNLMGSLSSLEQFVSKKTKQFQAIPVVIKAKVNDDALAKSHRTAINEFFQKKGKDKTIGLTKNNELFVRVDSSNEFKQMAEKLSNFDDNAKAISALENLDPFEVSLLELNEYPKRDGKYVLKIKLFDYKNYRINAKVEDEFKNIILSNKQLDLVKTVQYSRHLKVHEVTADSFEAIHVLAEFSGTLAIDPMPMFEVNEDDFFAETDLKFPQPEKEMNYPVVGVLDSGIAPTTQLESWIIDKHTNVPDEYINQSHGTFVAGIVAFGDLFEKKTLTGVNGCKLFNATVFPDASKEKISETDLVENIRDAIEKKKDEVKVWNMSLGSMAEADQNEFSDFGIALDNIQDEHEVLIIKSAGNCNNFLNKKSVSRIARGADSVRSLTVGSVAHSQNVGDLSKVNTPSPFSRIGPGPSFIIKPELVHYGGNCGVDNGVAIINGVSSLSQDGLIKKAIGTSFSTPRVAAIAADLNLKLLEEFDPILIKALLLHSASYPDNVDMEINQKIDQMGFGLPKKADEILFNNPHEITVVLRDSISKGEYIEILDFPYPESLIDEDGHYTGQIILTLVNNPILDSQQGPEYCQSNIDVKFGTYDQKKLRDTTKPIIKNELGKEGAQNLLQSSLYSKKKAAKDLVEFANHEKTLIKYGNKFYPNRKYALDLTELTKSNKEKFLISPKNWYLKLEGLFRSHIEQLAESERSDLTQEFCMLLTIRDPNKKAPVYQEVSKLLEINNFIHRNIKINQNIDIRLDDDTMGL